MLKKDSGFSMIEFLVVVAVLGIFVSVILIVINPNRQISQFSNAARRTDTGLLLDSISQFAVDHKGKLPANMPTKGSAPVEIKKTPGGADICADIVPTYISQLPTDPTLNAPSVGDCSSAYATGYTVAVDAKGKVTVAAPDAEAFGGSIPVISVTR